jgi:uncharacterized protein (DUF1501 family)
MLSRRELLQRFGAGVVAAATPTISFARANTESRLVVVILRGAMDGLAMLPAYGDSQYAALRGQLALASPGTTDGALKLDGLFGLHPSFSEVHALYRNNEAMFIHAIASPYRQRSHFDGQDVLENGVTSAGERRDGWLNRAIAPLGGRLGQEAAIALAQNTPLILRGINSVTSWAPSQLPEADDATLDRLARLYANDDFFSTRLAQALDSQEIAGDMGNMDGRRRRGNEAAQVKATMQQAGRFLSAEAGPRIAVVESGGWDTHANQGAAAGSLANKFAALDQGIAALRSELVDFWSETAVVVVTEFGRTAGINGTRGTDHGTASAAMLLGGAISGGRVLADWPGLSSRNLYQARDLKPTTDLRSLFKGILLEHLALPETLVETSVFPESAGVRAIENLIRS